MRCLVIASCLAGCWTSSSPANQPVSNTARPVVAKVAKAGHAETIQHTSAGGVIQLEGDRSAAIDDASSLMDKHCGPNSYTIVQEGEEAIGVDQSDGTTKITTAWRVHYQCSN